MITHKRGNIVTLALILLAEAALFGGCANQESRIDDGRVFSDLPPPQQEQKPAPRLPRFGPPPPTIFVGGEFKNPVGRYPWINGMTLKDAIDAAGGLTDFARHRIWL